MRVFDDVLGAIGHTPLIKLGRIAAKLPCTLVGKLEAVNPGGSIKDRIGLAMIEDAERRGVLKPGGTIVEATAGNTGVGLALVAAIKGYRCIFVMPDKMSTDKVNLLKAYGAEVVITPTSVPPDSPQSYNGVADRLAREIPGGFRPHQFANQCNPQAHYATTGPEIWADTDGKVDVLVAGMGTGGTISGAGRYLKERNPKIQVVGADPEGSILSGDAPHSYLVEGIGEDFIPATFDRQAIDDFVRVSDAEAFAMARRLAREEGLLVGGSAGVAVVAAIKYAARLPAGKLLVAVLPDTGRNYLGKIFSDDWMAEHGFRGQRARRFTARDVLACKTSPEMLSVGPEEMASAAVRLLEEHDISQLPVLEGGRNVGSFTELAAVKLLHDGVDLGRHAVRDVMGKPLPEVPEDTDLEEPLRLLLAGHGGVIVNREGRAAGFLARIDLVRFFEARQAEGRHG
ncbi:MAG: cystathionine beta-synthase [Deltaproteobacteria bacterium]|nr:cystathionine beta-synthase [Deltaproteobacteria bacterium]